MKRYYIFYILAFLLLASCAKMGQPDGGWYDETPPRVIGASPADGGVNVKSKKVNIYFDEFVKLDNPSEKVVVSPPQLETPDIKTAGKKIVVSLVDSLKPNTTYTIDFSDAISDNNENNPMGNYTYSFSTGDAIDTLEVSGYVLESENLEPIKGILVGLYDDHADSAFKTKPMLRVSRTDSRGRFVIKGVAPGSYRIYALQDMDGNYIFNQKSEKLAFTHDIVVPSFKADVRQDTTWIDSLHIKSIDQVNYTHFLPDNIVLRAFTEQLTDRFLVKTERQDADNFTLYFSYGDSILPTIKGRNFDESDAFIIEPSEHNDTLTYWLRDTALVNQDTLELTLTYRMTDSTGILVNRQDTVALLAKVPYIRRLKQQAKELEEWTKQQEKNKKKGLPYDSVMKPKSLEVKLDAPSQLAPDKNISFEFPAPLAKADTSAIHLYAKHDTLWYRAPFEFHLVKNREYELMGEWRPDIEYSLEIDSAAFQSIYGLVSKPIKQGFKVSSLDDYGTLLVNITSLHDKPLIVQLLNGQDGVVKSVKAINGVAEFYYLHPGRYYLRLIVDENENGKWDTGEYDADKQAEEVYYYPSYVECKAKWDLTESWDPLATELFRQKPGAITKQKPDKEKKVKNQNVERAKKLGIEYIPKL